MLENSTECPMYRDYDLFETVADRLEWRGIANGYDNAFHALRTMAARSSNEFYAIHTPSKTVIIRFVCGKPKHRE
jgi:hypothetical protein